jgi:hypothetical protein
MKKILKYLFLIPAIVAALPLQASAMCPICTIAAAGGIELSRLLGIDDTITGLWVGGLTVSLIMWTENWLDKKVFHYKGKEFTIRFKGRIFANIVFYLLLLIVPLYFMNVIGQPSHALQFFGIDKLIFGSVVGAITFWFGGTWYEYLKEKNGGHAWFPFQKVVMPIAPLIIMSFIFYYLVSVK